MLSVVLLEKFQEIQGVCSLEGAVFEFEKDFAVFFLMVQDKIIRCPIHQFYQFTGIVDDGFALAPGEHGRPEAHDLAVLFETELVGNRNGVGLNKTGAVVLIDGGFEKLV